jgi:hypothetical protein
MAVSSLVPASAGITVSDGNTAGWGKTSDNWVLLGRVTSNATSHNFTSLGGYKKLKINIARAEVTVSTQIRLQFNGDTANNYSTSAATRAVGFTNPVYINNTMSGGWYNVLSSPSSGGAILYVTTIIDNADSTVGAKHLTQEAVHNDANFSNNTHSITQGHWNNLSAITSLNLYLISGQFNLTGSPGFIEVWGTN